MDSIGSLAISVAMVIGPILAYIPQYVSISKTNFAVPDVPVIPKSAAGSDCELLDDHPSAAHYLEAFSPLVSFILVISSVIRILYWILIRFELPLLLQAIIIVIVQLALIEVIVRKRTRYRNDWAEKHGKDDAFLRHDAYRDVYYYSVIGLLIILLFSIVPLIVILVLSSKEPPINWTLMNYIAEAVGYSALFLESTVVVPQVVHNHLYPDTACKGLSKELVASWFLFDGLKTWIYWYRSAPNPFIVSGCIQITFDFVIVLQMIKYHFYNRRANRAPQRSAQHVKFSASIQSVEYIPQRGI